jgi:hypothetical protein
MPSDGHRQLIEGDRDTDLDRLIKGELVVAAAQILNECVPGDYHSGAEVGLEPAHRPKAPFQLAVIGFEPVVGVLLGAIPGRGRQLVEHLRVHRRLVGDDLDRRDFGRADGVTEETAGRRGVPARKTNTSMTWPNWSIASTSLILNLLARR